MDIPEMMGSTLFRLLACDHRRFAAFHNAGYGYCATHYDGEFGYRYCQRAILAEHAQNMVDMYNGKWD